MGDFKFSSSQMLFKKKNNKVKLILIVYFTYPNILKMLSFQQVFNLKNNW